MPPGRTASAQAQVGMQLDLARACNTAPKELIGRATNGTAGCSKQEQQESRGRSPSTPILTPNEI